MRSRVAAVGVLAGVLSCAAVSGSALGSVVEPLFEQAPVPLDVVNGLTSTSASGYRTYDDFAIESGGLVTGMTWRGYYRNFDFTEVVALPTDSFRIEIYADSGRAAPFTPLAERVFATTIGVYESTLVSHTEENRYYYDFAVDFKTAFRAEAGVTYWLSVVSLQVVAEPLWSWSAGYGDDGASRQYVDGEYLQRGLDRAFTLIPAPSGVLVLAGAGLSLRRRRVRA